MKFFTAIALFAAAAIAAPSPSYNADGPTVSQIHNECGDSVVACCNEETVNDGALAGTLGGLLSGCNPISLNVILNLADQLFNQHCATSAACCQGTQVDQHGSLVAIGCVPVDANL